MRGAARGRTLSGAIAALCHRALDSGDLRQLGLSPEAIAVIPYGEAVGISWANYYLRLTSSGLFLGNQQEVQILPPYGAETMEGTIRSYRQRYGDPNQAPEPFLIHDKSRIHPEWQVALDEQVAGVRAAWQALRLPFPELSDR